MLNNFVVPNITFILNKLSEIGIIRTFAYSSIKVIEC